jgi:hypothetical protein
MKKQKIYRILVKPIASTTSSTRLAGKTAEKDIEEEIEAMQEFIVKAQHIYTTVIIGGHVYNVIKVKEYK